MDYEKFCSQILDADPKIRFATVYDEWASRAGGGMRNGVVNQLSEHAENELVNISILDWKARKDMSKWLGLAKYTLVEYDKVKRFSFYLGDDHLLLVSTEKDTNTDSIVEQVIKLYYENQK
ncbi:MAG: hypothetical protein HOK63_07090 [Thaumarchaeota archaeon]|jgi:hypothetical protein|nr:hypothetical protein [Nitrososphaerota archaeon]MBT5842716.1 hypothetical protein [Nitrososphaerota archaeon]MBT6469393.1 hypothetical protein [Nitrososphaerota archaeon]